MGGYYQWIVTKHAWTAREISKEKLHIINVSYKFDSVTTKKNFEKSKKLAGDFGSAYLITYVYKIDLSLIQRGF